MWLTIWELMYPYQKCTTAAIVSINSSQRKKKRKEKHEKMSSQLKLDMTSGIITADHPFITLCCQEDIWFLTSGPSRIAMVLFAPELGNQHLHESPEVNNKWSYNLPAQDCHVLFTASSLNTTIIFLGTWDGFTILEPRNINSYHLDLDLEFSRSDHKF